MRFRHHRYDQVLALVLGLLALGTISGCKGGFRENPILALSAEESLAAGKALLADEKYSRARPYLIHAFEVEPNSANGREALLLAADTFYLEGGSTNYLQAEAKYRDFLNRFPTSDRSAYAQFQVASTLARRMEKPDRDQTTTRAALTAFEDLLRLYPTTEYAAEARDQIRLVRDNLAEHEFMVGEFYLKYGIPRAAIGRLEYLLENFSDYGAKDKVYFHLGRAYKAARRIQDAAGAFERLRQQFPDSPFIAEIPELPDIPEEETVPQQEPAPDKGHEGTTGEPRP